MGLIVPTQVLDRVLRHGIREDYRVLPRMLDYVRLRPSGWPNRAELCKPPARLRVSHKVDMP